MTDTIHTKLGEGRRIAIPAEVCQKFGLHPGDPVTIQVTTTDLRIVPLMQVIREVQEAFAPYKKPGVSVVEELIQERRADAARENDE